MSLTSAQLAAIKADIAANGDLNSEPNNSDGDFNIAAKYNALASPDYLIWRTECPMSEIMGNGFDWTIVDNLTVGKARIWEWMAQLGSINFNLANVRAGINAGINVSGTADDTMRTAIYGHGSQKASRVLKLLKESGSGTVSNDQGVGPATLPANLSSEYQISGPEVRTARDLP